MEVNELEEKRGTWRVDDTDAVTPAEADVHKQMRQLANLFLKLLTTIPHAGLACQVSSKRLQGLVICAANVYSGPSTQETLVDVARPGTQVRVFAEIPDQAFPPGNVWYRISKPSKPSRYICAESVIRGSLYPLLQRYFQLGSQLWEAVATDRLEEIACVKKEEARSLKRQLEPFKVLCQNIKQDPHAKRSSKGQRQVRRCQHALRAWRRCLGKDASTMLSNSTECGRILYCAQGSLGLASCNRFDYMLIQGLQWLVVPMIPLSFLFPIFNPFSSQLLLKMGMCLLMLIASIYLLWFSASGTTSLPMMMGYTLTRQQAPVAARPWPVNKTNAFRFGLFQAFFYTGVHKLRKLWPMRHRLLGHSNAGDDDTRSLQNERHRLLRYWLRFWGIYLAAALSIDLLLPIFLPDMLGSFGNPIAFYIFWIIILIWAFCLETVFLIASPFTLTMQAHMRRELLAYPQRSPKARRSAVYPAMKLLSFNAIIFTIITFTIASVLVHTVPAFSPLGAPVSSALPSFITPAWFVCLLVVLLLYLLCLEFPYRWGVSRWKTCRLDELAHLRQRFDQRLSKVPFSSIEDEDRSSTQDDYAHWQYYRALEEDVKQIPQGLFSFVHQGWIFLVAIASSFLVNSASSFLVNSASNLLHIIARIGH